MEKGLIDANLGGGLVKKRVALAGRGKRGGTRTIVAYRRSRAAFFIYGFEKAERSNLGRRELSALKLLAKTLLNYTPAELARAQGASELAEVKDDG